MKRHNFLRLFLIVFCILLIQGKNVFSQERLIFTHGPYLVDPGEKAITVVWFTNKKCLSWVEYCGDKNLGVFPIWGGYPQTAKSSRYGLIDANTKKHSIRISNLEPGTKYRYRVVSKEILVYDPYEVLYGDTIVGDVLEFETLNPDKTNFSFGVVTDVHERVEKLDALLQITPMDSMDMMFYNGDILNWIGDESRIFSGFLDVSVKHFAKEKPFVFMRGNHETRGPSARGLMSYFPHSSGKYYYSFNQGNVHFIILDSGEDKPDSHPVYAGLADFDNYREEQTKWLREEVQSESFKKATYRIALFHVPLFSGSKKHGAGDITEKWGPILNDANIDLTIHGHHHRYSRIEPTEGKNRFPVVIVDQDMIAKTDVSEKQLTVTIKNIDGNIVDKFSIPAKLKRTQ
jgi:Calcineurin-like phosphoesterase/Purple acid Phosphatase, N-terminal domain